MQLEQWQAPLGSPWHSANGAGSAGELGSEALGTLLRGVQHGNFRRECTQKG